MSKKTPILAAGGVVVNDQNKIVVVYRKRQDDWTLPKGKLEVSETFEQAAVREIYEETGVLATPRFLIGHSQYRLKEGKQKGRLKVVYFFLMDLIDQYNTQLAKDVQRREWYSFDEAWDILSHDKDRKILEAAFYGPASKNGS